MSLRTEDFKSSASNQFRHAPSPFDSATTRPPSAGRRWEAAMRKWRRRADSNRRIADLQSAPLTTWVRRRALKRRTFIPRASPAPM